MYVVTDPYLLTVLAVLLGAAMNEGRYVAGGGVPSPDFDVANRYAESLPEPAAVEGYVEPVTASRAAGGRSGLRQTKFKLRDFRQIRELPLNDRNASGVAFLSDDTVLITYQTFLKIHDLDGRELHTIGPVDGDIEGLEYDNEKLIAVDERGSTRHDLSHDGQDFTPVHEKRLPVRGIECVAYDGSTNLVYYGHEATGRVLDAELSTLISLERDLAGCTMFDGQFLALASHPWRESAWYRVDTETWEVVEKKALADGDWEGIACRGNRCVLVRETSEKSGAAMVIFERSGVQP